MLVKSFIFYFTLMTFVIEAYTAEPPKDARRHLWKAL